MLPENVRKILRGIETKFFCNRLYTLIPLSQIFHGLSHPCAENIVGKIFPCHLTKKPGYIGAVVVYGIADLRQRQAFLQVVLDIGPDLGNDLLPSVQLLAGNSLQQERGELMAVICKIAPALELAGLIKHIKTDLEGYFFCQMMLQDEFDKQVGDFVVQIDRRQMVHAFDGGENFLQTLQGLADIFLISAVQTKGQKRKRLLSRRDIGETIFRMKPA